MKLISTIYPTSKDENAHFFASHPTSIYQDSNGQFFIATKYETFPQKKLFSICESYFTPLSYILKIADVIQMPHKEIKKSAFYSKLYTIQFGTEKQREKFIHDQDWRVRATVFQYFTTGKRLHED